MLNLRAAIFASIIGLFVLTLVQPSWGQNIPAAQPVAIGNPIVQAPSTSNAPNTGNAIIQVYNVPIEMVGVVGARLLSLIHI